jgi:hypothetical protein
LEHIKDRAALTEWTVICEIEQNEQIPGVEGQQQKSRHGDKALDGQWVKMKEGF